MTIMIIAIVAFLFLLFLPLFGSYLFYKRDKVKLLRIDAHKIKDPRYFSKSFTALMENHLVDYSGNGEICLSRADKMIEADKTEQFPKICDSLIYVESKEFFPSGVESFEKEIFARENVILSGCKHIRALCCKKDAILGKGIYVHRWVDAEGTLTIYDNCNLGVSASSASKLVIGANCEFRRLYAPLISIGQYPKEEESPEIMSKNISPFVSEKILRNIGYVDDSHGDEDGVVNRSIITWKNLAVTDDMVVKGDIRSHRKVRLCDNVVVCGNIFAEGNVILGRNSWVMGTIFTQEDIIAEEGVVIGREGKTSSVIARGSIILSYKTRIYGYVSTEDGGFICPDWVEGVGTRVEERELLFPAKPMSLARLCFYSLENYRNTDEDRFRNNTEIKEVEIPDGATVVPRSFFFQCSEIRLLMFPSTLQEIGDFAFYGCEGLEVLDLRHCVNLDRIGESAFEKCTSLKVVYLPKHLQCLGSAVFRGCANLKIVNFASNKDITVLMSHCFMDCSSLENLSLPQSLTEIQISAFYGCSSLQSITIPKKVKTVGHYAFCNCDNCHTVRIHQPLPLRETKGFPKSIKVELIDSENKKVHGEMEYGIDK